MPVVIFAGNRPGSGQTTIIAGLLHLLKQAGQTPAYYKPFSPTPDSDPDAAFLSHYLDANNPPTPHPHSSATALDPQTAQEITAALTALDASSSIVLVEASQHASQLTSHLNANGPTTRAVLVAAYEKETTPSAVQPLAAPFGDSLLGVAFNHCPPYRQEQLNREVIAPLREQNMPVLGALTEDRPLLAVTVQQIADHLGGTWVQDPENADATVDRFLIGGNIMDSGPNYFGRYPNQAVITRAQRPDIQLASLMCETKCLVLTGGGQPTEYIRVEAANRGVPLISVNLDTLAAAEALQDVLGNATPHHLSKIHRAAQLVQERLEPLLTQTLTLAQAG